MKRNMIKVINTVFVAGALIILYLSSLYNYLLFHTIAEIFSVCIAATVFLLAWNSIKYIKNNYLILVGVAYLFIGFLDLFHTMAYKGMRVFTDYDYYANQLWIAARYFESIILLIAFIFVKSKKKINEYILFGVFTFVTTLIMLSIFIWRTFPICFVDGLGLTPFKKISEYIICIILVVSIIILTKNKESFEGVVYKYLLISLICTIISELAFTTYINNYGLSNLVGHYFKIFSFFLVYKAIIVKGVREPYDLIFREMKQTQQKLSEQNNILKNQAIIDGLTGLYNHRHIYERMEEESKRCSRNKCCYCIMLIDIDYFKNINDTHGHLVGDRILIQLSSILKDNTRQSDFVGRYGGEEFLIMLVETDIDKGREVAEKIRKIVEGYEFDNGIRLTISIGIAGYNNEKVRELLEKADKNLYTAKNSGRNRTV